jgi:hypothetical protein
MEVFDENDLKLLMTLLEPVKFSDSSLSIEEGLLSMSLDDEIKLELCHLLHSVCDYLLRYRIESIISFTVEFVSNLQSDQKKRYLELKEATLPSAIMAKKTKEFRCPARDQMQTLIKFKSNDEEKIDLDDDLKLCLKNFNEMFNRLTRIKQVEETEQDVTDNKNSRSFMSKLFRLLFYSDYENLSESDANNEIVLDSSKQNLPSLEYLSGATNESISGSIIRYSFSCFYLKTNFSFSI